MAALLGKGRPAEVERLLASALLLEVALLLTLIALLSLAMGVRNTVARGVGDPNLATTALNLTLVASTRADLAAVAALAAAIQRQAPAAARVAS